MNRDDLARMMQGMTHEDMLRTLELLEELDTRKRVKICQESLHAFVMHMQPDYKMGTHLHKLYELLEDVEMGERDRILVNCPPRFGKSMAVSTYFPAWYIGNNPTHKIIIASHTADLAVDFLRKVRNLMQSDEYKEIFPDVSVAADAKAAGKWNTNHGGEAFACGVGGALSGRGSHLLLIDDPFSESAVINGNYEVFDKVYEWFTYGARTRLMPGGRIAVIHCLVGGTEITMANGATKRLRDIRPGDMVASYERGLLRPAKVLNWKNQGIDRVYTLVMKSGNILRGNERHPLLVDLNGVETWIKIKDLKPGMSLVSMKAAKNYPEPQLCGVCVEGARLRRLQLRKKLGGHPLLNKTTNALQKIVQTYLRPKLGKVYATHASPDRATIKSTQTPPIYQWATTGNGKGWFARQKGVRDRFSLMGTALPALARYFYRNASPEVTKYTAQPNDGSPTSKLDTESTKSNTLLCTQPKKDGVLSVVRNLTKVIHQRVGKTINWLSTTATKQGKSERYSVTRAILSSKTATASTYCKGPLSTLRPTLDEILSITLDSEQEDVFDIQVEGTENFIANGVVSHNTRWSQLDLTARLLKDGALNKQADQYELFEFPAILNEGTPEEKSLWPEQWTLDSLKRTKASMPLFQWNAQYQQNPTNADSGIVVKEWFKIWKKETPPNCEFIIMALDAAVEAKKRSDFNALTTWGVWFNETTNRNEIILLNSLNFRAEFPDLKDKCRQEYDYWQPDSFIIEQKANGAPLIQEFRAAGVYVTPFVPHRGTGDKTMRLGAVADMIRDGVVWVPETRWAEELVEQVSSFPSGAHDDLCLVGDTLITMADGSKKPICEVAVGELVCTPFGPCKVLESRCTGVKPVVEFAGVRGTANHPIMTTKGWKNLGQLNRNDVIIDESTLRGSSWLKAKLILSWWYLMENVTGATQTLKETTYGTILDALAGLGFSIGIYGSTLMALSQKATTSITKTGTALTTVWRISNAFLRKSIGMNIGSKESSLAEVSSSKNTSLRSDHSQLSGIALRKGLPGIESMQKTRSTKSPLKAKRSLSRSVFACVANLSFWGPPEKTTAVQFVGASLTERRLTQKIWLPEKEKSVTSANVCIPLQQSGSDSAPLSVKAYTTTHWPNPVEKVYNLKVDRCPWYFANGVLTHNCDALTMSLTRMRQGGFVTLTSDEDQDDGQYEGRVAKYY
jgi:predicted phage terminase large subunit-like protein